MAVRCLALDCMAGKNDFGINWWQDKYLRARDRYMRAKFPALPAIDARGVGEHFGLLLESVRENGLLPEYPITTDRSGHLANGMHRLSIASQLGLPRVFVERRPDRISATRNNGREWLRNNAFSAAEMEVVENKKHEIFRGHHLYFPIIIWPPAADIAGEIADNIKNDPGFEYICETKIDFKTDDGLAEFIRAVRAPNDTLSRGFDSELAFKYTGIGIISIVWVDNRFVNFRMGADGNLISQTAEELKERLGKKYKGRAKNHVYDIILHIGGNYDDNKAIDEAVRNYE
jgi:hypothetical protein